MREEIYNISGMHCAACSAAIERVTRRMDGSHTVSSDNPSVKTVDVLDGSQQVRICGRVVYGWNGRRL